MFRTNLTMSLSVRNLVQVGCEKFAMLNSVLLYLGNDTRYIVATEHCHKS